MKQIIKPLILALFFGSQVPVAMAQVQNITIAPGDTLSVGTGDDTVFTGVVSVSGNFTHSYFIDFQTNNNQSDLWSFRVHGVGLSLNGTPITGLSGLSMALYDGNNSLLWNMPAGASITDTITPAGTLTVTDRMAYSAAFYEPGFYRFDVTGEGTGFYDVTLSVPEPETWAMFLAGAALLSLRLRNRNA